MLAKTFSTFRDSEKLGYRWFKKQQHSKSVSHWTWWLQN